VDMDIKIDLLEDDCKAAKGGDEVIYRGHINSLEGSNVNNLIFYMFLEGNPNDQFTFGWRSSKIR